MSTIGAALTSWEEFLKLPEPPDTGVRYELHDGEVVQRVPPKPIHTYIQALLVKWFNRSAGDLAMAIGEFPYRPAANLQFWIADVALMPTGDFKAIRKEGYRVYSPPLIIEVLSPSNEPEKLNRQRVAAFGAGTLEFWVVDPRNQTIEVSAPDRSPRVYRLGESVPVPLLAGAELPVQLLFE